MRQLQSGCGRRPGWADIGPGPGKGQPKAGKPCHTFCPRLAEEPGSFKPVILRSVFTSVKWGERSCQTERVKRHHYMVSGPPEVPVSGLPLQLAAWPSRLAERQRRPTPKPAPPRPSAQSGPPCRPAPGRRHPLPVPRHSGCAGPWLHFGSSLAFRTEAMLHGKGSTASAGLALPLPVPSTPPSLP